MYRSNMGEQNTFSETDNKKQKKKSSLNNIQSRIVSQYTKLRESVHKLFSNAKTELATIYKTILTQISRIGNQTNDKTKLTQEFLEEICFIRKEAQAALLDFPIKLMNILIIPKIFSKSFQSTLNSQSVVNYNESQPNNTKKRQENQQNNFINSIKGLNESAYINSVKKINLNNMKNQESLSFLETEWPLLQILSAEGKGLDNLCSFKNVKANSLQILNFNNNQLIQIKSFKNACFPSLKILNLSTQRLYPGKNKIKSIQGLDQAKIQKLNMLNLSFNNIKKLKPLTKCIFPQLFQLHLTGNHLQSVEDLNGCDFKNLQVLSLDNNKLTSLNSLGQSSFYRLKVLSFSYNKIKSLQFLKKIFLRRMQAIFGHNNKITQIEPLKYCEMSLIKQIILHDNQITNISCLKQTDFPSLKGLDLQKNKICPRTFCCFVIDDKGYNVAKKKYPFILI